VQALDQTRTIVVPKNRTVTVYNRRPEQRISVENFDPDVRERKNILQIIRSVVLKTQIKFTKNRVSNI
jgi:hypothetical protein